MILINVTKCIKYLPLSYNTLKNKHRADILYDLAVHKKTTIDKMEVEFAMYISQIIKLQLEQAIKTQSLYGKSMASIYPKLSKYYNSTKPTRTQDKFWINSGELVKRLRIWKSTSGVNIGFPPNKKHPHSKANLVDILGWMENGNSITPARPLFKPIIVHISKNIDTYFFHFLKLQGIK